ncbi:MAG: hypothetical protein H5T39_07305 [Methanobacteriales archaeon]|nr:hypothetical protein [Methanobacteriales archaeon]
MKENSINRRKALRMEPKELEGKIIVGDFVREEKEELTTVIYDLIEEKCGERFRSIKSAYKG